MTPEEELRRLNTLIHRYDTVYRTTPDPDQKERVQKQLKELHSYKEKILKVNIIDSNDMEETTEVVDAFADFPILAGLLLADKSGSGAGGREENQEMSDGVEIPEEIYHLTLYTGYFAREFLPFLTEKQLKLDFKFSMDRDAFYGKYQDLLRKIEDLREEYKRIHEGIVGREMELEIRKRSLKIKMGISMEAARFFRAVQRFARELEADAIGEGVKCLNGDRRIAFDSIEGDRVLEGVGVREALGKLEAFVAETVSYLNVPDIETQENERADRH